MKKLILSIIAAMSVVAILALAGCSEAGSGFTFGSGSLECKGKAVTIKLDGNPTTGYEWTYEKVGDALVYKSDSFALSGKSGEAGTGGYYTYMFEGEKEGTTKMSFTYSRNGQKAADDLTVNVEVTTSGTGKVTSTQVVSSDGTGGSTK